MPKVSIIVPTKNRLALLMETIASVQAQTYQNWELLVVDDCSFDDTREAVTRLSREDSRIRYFPRISARRGASVCRNQGFTHSAGHYVMFLDSDDWLAPDCLRHRVDAVMTHKADFAIFGCKLFQDSPGDCSRFFNQWTSEDDLSRFLNLDNPWVTMSALWTHDSFSRLGLWDERLPSFQDWELSVRAICFGFRYVKVPMIDCYYRMRSPNRESISMQSSSPKHLLSHELLLAKVHEMLAYAGRLDAANRLRLSGLYFWVATFWVQRGYLRKALNVWKIPQRRALVDARIRMEGNIYLAVARIPLLNRVMLWYLKSRWPEQTFSKGSSTFLNATQPA